MSFEDYQLLTFTRRDHGVLLITMNRPEKYNAADERMHTELARVWTDVSADPGTRVAVITGRAGRSRPVATWPWSSGWPVTTTGSATCSAR